MELVFWTLFFLFFPVVILYLAYKVDACAKLGAIVIAYAVGLVVGNIGVLPDAVESIQHDIATYVVPFAIPLIFFSLEIGRWRTLAKTSALSLAAGMVAIFVGSLLSFVLFHAAIGDEAWKAAGMLVGVYTGGTLNLAAIGTALQIDPLLYVAVHGSDVVVSAFILLLLVAVAPRALRGVLPPFRADDPDADDENEFSIFFTGASGRELLEMVIAVLIAGFIVALGASFLLFLPENFAIPLVIMTITALGIAASFVAPVRRLRNSFQIGHYLLLVFSLVVSALADVRELSVEMPVVVAYVAVLLAITWTVHVVLSAVLKIDRDTHIITVTSFIFSPPFVPVVAATLSNKKVVVSGIVIGVIGWMLGNYLGLAVAYFLRALT